MVAVASAVPRTLILRGALRDRSADCVRLWQLLSRKKRKNRKERKTNGQEAFAAANVNRRRRRRI